MQKEDLIILSKCALFKDIGDIDALINEFKGSISEHSKGEIIKEVGSPVELIILLKGSAVIYSDDYLGNRSIINRISAGDIFGGAHIFSGTNSYITEMVTTEQTKLLSIKKDYIDSAESKNAKIFLSNALTLISEKCLFFLEKNTILSKRKIRERVLAYLSDISKKQNSKYIRIPFNRQELADYLGVDRSALSIELSKMKKEGLIDYRKNDFKIKSAE